MLVKKLLAAKNEYERDSGNVPIRTSDYIAFLGAFESIIGMLQVPRSYENDFRRNLPAGGWRGLQVAPTLKDRVGDVREFVAKNPVFAAAGAALLTNILASEKLCAAQGVDLQCVLSSIASNVVRVSRGDLR